MLQTVTKQTEMHWIWILHRSFASVASGDLVSTLPSEDLLMLWEAALGDGASAARCKENMRGANAQPPSTFIQQRIQRWITPTLLLS